MSRSVCKIYCKYYKPEKNEKVKCLPFRLIKKLDKQFFSSTNTLRQKSFSKKLKKLLCERCNFYPDDCDFVDEDINGNPCGGFIFFDTAIKENIIDLKFIKTLLKTER